MKQYPGQFIHFDILACNKASRGVLTDNAPIADKLCHRILVHNFNLGPRDWTCQAFCNSYKLHRHEIFLQLNVAYIA